MWLWRLASPPPCIPRRTDGLAARTTQTTHVHTKVCGFVCPFSICAHSLCLHVVRHGASKTTKLLKLSLKHADKLTSPLSHSLGNCAPEYGCVIVCSPCTPLGG